MAETQTTPKTFGTGKFTFAVQKGAPIPKEVTAPPPKRVNELFFKDWFEEAEHADHLFIPDSFWTAPKEEGGRGIAVEPAKVQAYGRAKVRDQFNTWRKKTEEEGKDNPRAGFGLSIFPRRAGDRMDEASPAFPEDGLSLFFVDNASV